MLMTALAAGRGISLPVIIRSGRGLCRAHHWRLCADSRAVQRPIGKFEGIEEPLARIAGTAYLLDAARRLTCAALNQGHHPRGHFRHHETAMLPSGCGSRSTTPWTSMAARL